MRFEMSKNMETIEIKLNVSENNEGTESPWWAILEPRQNMPCDPHQMASMITGPFFSREDAQAHLDSTSYNYSKNAVVYCLSGYHSRQYKQALRDARGAK